MLLGIDSALAYTNEPRCTNSLQLFASGGCALHPVDEIEHAESSPRYVAPQPTPLFARRELTARHRHALYRDRIVPPSFIETTLLIFIALQRLRLISDNYLLDTMKEKA